MRKQIYYLDLDDDRMWHFIASRRRLRFVAHLPVVCYCIGCWMTQIGTGDSDANWRWCQWVGVVEGKGNVGWERGKSGYEMGMCGGKLCIVDVDGHQHKRGRYQIASLCVEEWRRPSGWTVSENRP